MWATKKNPPTFHYTGWLIGILILAYYNPHIVGQYNPLYQTTNQGFQHCSSGFLSWICLFDAWKKVKHILPNGGLMVNYPGTIRKKHHQEPSPKFNSEFTPENRPKPKRKGSYSNHPFFRGKPIVSGRVYIYIHIYIPDIPRCSMYGLFTYKLRGVMLNFGGGVPNPSHWIAIPSLFMIITARFQDCDGYLSAGEGLRGFLSLGSNTWNCCQFLFEWITVVFSTLVWT